MTAVITSYMDAIASYRVITWQDIQKWAFTNYNLLLRNCEEMGTGDVPDTRRCRSGVIPVWCRWLVCASQLCGGQCLPVSPGVIMTPLVLDIKAVRTNTQREAGPKLWRLTCLRQQHLYLWKGFFSHGGLFMRPHRARMSDNVLSSLVYIKCNKHLT